MFSSFRHHTSQQGTSCLPQTDSFQKLPATIGSNVIVMEFFFLLCVVRTTPISTNEKSMKSALPSDNILPTMYKKSTSITFDGFSFFKAFFKFSSLDTIKKKLQPQYINTRFLYFNFISKITLYLYTNSFC